jgi:hypothetical protein
VYNGYVAVVPRKEDTRRLVVPSQRIILVEGGGLLLKRINTRYEPPVATLRNEYRNRPAHRIVLLEGLGTDIQTKYSADLSVGVEPTCEPLDVARYSQDTQKP